MHKYFLIFLFFLTTIYSDTIKNEFIHYKNNFSVVSFEDDLYHLDYNGRTKECRLFKNGDEIEVFDKRFNREMPYSPYACAMWQKENYLSCKNTKSVNVYGFTLSFGTFNSTRLLAAFLTAGPKISGHVDIKCSKNKRLE